MKHRVCLMVSGLLLFFFSYSPAQVPQMINYQGKLTKTSGAPLDTTISMIFSIYADSNGSVLKWAETQVAVKVEKGIFNVLLGSSNPIPDTVFNGALRYLGVKVGGDPEIIPRKAMVSVPYAYRAGATSDNDWVITGDTIYHLDGNVGIGTTTPSVKLHVSNTRYDDGTPTNLAAIEQLGYGAPVLRISNPNTANSNIARMLKIQVSGNYDPARGLMGMESDHGLGLITNNSERLIITNTGNVGIGTTTPNEQLEITENLRLPPTTATTGIIKVGEDRFIHNFGVGNTFLGVNAGNFNISGMNNTATGQEALYTNATGGENTANGYGALRSNGSGFRNTAIGEDALNSNTTGSHNTAVGWLALQHNTTGNWNTALGGEADVASGNLSNATAIGWGAIVSISNALVLGGTGANAVKVGIGTSSPQGALDVTSTTGALIVPRMTPAQRDALTAVNGMIIYNTFTNQFNFYENGAWVTK